jgi:hypothetical protein
MVTSSSSTPPSFADGANRAAREARGCLSSMRLSASLPPRLRLNHAASAPTVSPASRDQRPADRLPAPPAAAQPRWQRVQQSAPAGIAAPDGSQTRPSPWTVQNLQPTPVFQPDEYDPAV